MLAAVSHAMPLSDERARRARNLKTALLLALVAAGFLAAYVIRHIIG